MTDDRETQWPDRLVPEPMTPQSVRNRTFGRAAIGRRGLDPDEVFDFLDQVADELARREARELRERNRANELTQALKAWKLELAEQRQAGQQAPASAPAPAPPPPPPVDPARPPVELVMLMSQTQQDCDQRIRQTQAYCEQLAAEAERYHSNLLAEAQRMAAEAAEAAARDYRAEAGADYSPDDEELRRRLGWVRAFVDSLSAAEAQLSAVREALQYDVDQLFGGGSRDRDRQASNAGSGGS
jgi:DivIVA domain-containing protein